VSRCAIWTAASCPQTPLRSGSYSAALSSTGLRISLVRVTSCHPRPLRYLPVGLGTYRGYRGGRRTRSCPARTAAAHHIGSPASCLLAVEPPPLAPAAFLRSGAPQAGRCKKNTCDGGCGTISPPIAPPPPPCPPLGLLPEPHRASVTGVSSAHHEKVGGASSIFREQSWFHRTRTSWPMPESAIQYHTTIQEK
jgi:hypothetical protein